MGRLCGGAYGISDIKAPIFLHGWVVVGVGRCGGGRVGGGGVGEEAKHHAAYLKKTSPVHETVKKIPDFKQFGRAVKL